MYKKIIDKIKFYFSDDIEKENIKLLNNVYSYKLLRGNNNQLLFITKDIITFNNNLKDILKDNDFEKDSDLLHILKVNNNLHNKMLYLWVTNDNHILNNLNDVIGEFIILSSIFIRKYNALIKYKKSIMEFQFNIRLLQPYIINIMDIRRCLLNLCKG